MMRSKLVSRPGARARFVLMAAQLLVFGCARGPQLPPPSAPEPAVVEPPIPVVIRPQPEPMPKPSAPAVALEEPGAPSSVDLVIDSEEAESFNTELPGPLPLHGAIVTQKVEDFAAWRAVFDAELDARKRAGFAAQGVMRGIDDPKLVVVWLAVTDVAHAKAYLSDKTVLTRFRRAGAIGAPQIQISSNIDAKMEPGRKGLSAAVVTLRVKEWPPFKVAFAAQAGARRAAGVIGYALSQDVDDEHLFYVYLQSADPAQLKAYLASKETKQAWRDAGLESGPFVKFVREGELALCR
jgi:quinol monooxygenase YgiN